METKNLSLLIEIVRRGSFAAAAKEQLIDPSSVSRVIAKLEEELGFRLFQRSTRRMAALAGCSIAQVKRVTALHRATKQSDARPTIP